VLSALALLAGAAPVSAHVGPTVIPTPTDARNDLPTRAGTWVQVDYGPFTIPAASGGTLGQIHNQAVFGIPAPCTDCYITDIIPGLVYNNGAGGSPGTNANLDSGVILHHMLASNPGTGKQDLTCPGSGPGLTGERVFAAGNERTHMHLPTGFGYQQGENSNWNMIYHLVNRNTTTKTVYIEMKFRYVAQADPVRPMWLDIDGMGSSCGDSEYTIPQGYSDTHASWTSTISGRIVGMSGHMHDVDITGANACTNHCANEGNGIAVSAELVGGPSSDYYGPNPPTNNGTPTSPPSDLTGATICRSEGYFGAFNPTEWRNHLDTVSLCMIHSSVPAGAQALAYPAGGAWPVADGYKINAGQVIKLHSEYQNDTGASQTDAMGIMVAYVSPTEPGYARPKAATPLYASLVPAYTPCAAPNRVHATPLNFNSCNPPTRTSGQLTTGSPDANGAAANFTGSAKFVVVNGNVATVADEADVNITVNITDVRNNDLSDYSGQLQLRPTFQITDRNNGPAEVGTGQSVDFPVTVPCTTTVSTTIGSTCSVNTTADAVQPGTVRETRRSNWELGQVKVFDGGADGLASTGPNTLYLTQGVFIP
jgi:hypothetical protein